MWQQHLDTVIALCSKWTTECRVTTAVFAALGAVVVLRLVFGVLGSLYRTFLRPSASLRKYKDQWAVVTGASDGIGAAYAQELAKRGINVALVSRTESKLKEVEKKITATTPTALVKTFAFDFEGATDKDWSQLTTALVALKPAMLVNNVGVNLRLPTRFEEATSAEHDSIVRVNCMATTRMTHALLPGMRERRSGALIFLSSASGLFPTPLLSVYAASKAFDNQLALSLAEELVGSGVTVQSLTPFFVVTPMSGARRATLLVPWASAWVKKAVGQLGVELRSNPHWPHALMAKLLLSLPESLRRWEVLKNQKTARARMLRRVQAESKSQ